MILVTSANGKTARHIIPLLLSKGRKVRALSHHLPSEPTVGVEAIAGDMNDPAVLARCVDGAEAVIHIGPTFHPREAEMGTALINAARDAQTPRFVYMSVIHPQIDDLVNHQNKLRVESHLVHMRMDWTILQPQHYMQNIDVKRAVADRSVALPYSAERSLGFVDIADVAEVAAKVVTEEGHRWATYELAASEHLSTRDIGAIIGAVSGVNINVGRLNVDEVIEWFGKGKDRDAFDDRSANALYRLFAYYDRYGITGNGNVLRWLLGRPATTFAAYCARQLGQGPKADGHR
jgi:uncharacterized protein YbjT (DUF2867 family)